MDTTDLALMDSSSIIYNCFTFIDILLALHYRQDQELCDRSNLGVGGKIRSVRK